MADNVTDISGSAAQTRRLERQRLHTALLDGMTELSAAEIYELLVALNEEADPTNEGNCDRVEGLYQDYMIAIGDTDSSLPTPAQFRKVLTIAARFGAINDISARRQADDFEHQVGAHC